MVKVRDVWGSVHGFVNFLKFVKEDGVDFSTSGLSLNSSDTVPHPGVGFAVNYSEIKNVCELQNCVLNMPNTLKCLATTRSNLLMKAIQGTVYLFICLFTVMV